MTPRSYPMATYSDLLCSGHSGSTKELPMFAYLSSLTARARDDRGATAVEYGLMVALIAVVIIAAVILLG